MVGPAGPSSRAVSLLIVGFPFLRSRFRSSPVFQRSISTLLLLSECDKSQVAWAGFPGTVEQLVGRPQPCYFEGVIASTVSIGGIAFYLVDGHNCPGVSGGPMWFHAPDGPQVVGITFAYHSDMDFPGFVLAAPIQELSKHFMKICAKAKVINLD